MTTDDRRNLHNNLDFTRMYTASGRLPFVPEADRVPHLDASLAKAKPVLRATELHFPMQLVRTGNPAQPCQQPRFRHSLKSLSFQKVCITADELPCRIT